MGGKKVFITGMGGYIAGRLCALLDRTDWCESVHGMDVKKPLYKWEKAEFRKMDINSPGLIDWIGELKPDVVAHLAFIVDPIPDEKLMERVNVDGTRNALEACARAGVPKALVASSGTAYGAWPDNPTPLTEDDPIRPHPGFKYANDKSRVEFICREFMDAHPETIMSVIRPCVVYGPLVNNYLSALLTMPVVTGPSHYNPPLQFVHEDDVARAIVTIIEKDGRGPYNVAPPDYIRLREAMKLTGRPSIRLPERGLEIMLGISWRLGLPLVNAPPSLLDFLRYPWVMDSSRLQKELGFEFRYSTRETVEIMLRAKGVIE